MQHFYILKFEAYKGLYKTFTSIHSSWVREQAFNTWWGELEVVHKIYWKGLGDYVENMICHDVL